MGGREVCQPRQRILGPVIDGMTHQGNHPKKIHILPHGKSHSWSFGIPSAYEDIFSVGFGLLVFCLNDFVDFFFGFSVGFAFHLL